MVAPVVIGAGISAAGSLLGGLAGQSSARSINKQSIALAREQMRFQERMSSTAYQRSAKDLEAAGLNRILALGSPASSPGGAQPPALKVPGEHIARGITSALQNAAVGAQIKLLGAQADEVQNKADILAPEAAIKGPAGELLDTIVTTVKKKGPGVLQSAKHAAEKIGGKIGVLDSPKITREEKSQLTLKEITYDPDATIPKNVQSWAAAYKKQHGKNPTEELLRRYAAYIKSIRQ